MYLLLSELIPFSINKNLAQGGIQTTMNSVLEYQYQFLQIVTSSGRFNIGFFKLHFYHQISHSSSIINTNKASKTGYTHVIEKSCQVALITAFEKKKQLCTKNYNNKKLSSGIGYYFEKKKQLYTKNYNNIQGDIHIGMRCLRMSLKWEATRKQVAFIYLNLFPFHACTLTKTRIG